MKGKKLLILLPLVTVAAIVVSSVAISGTTYSWEKTFEVTKPEIGCTIEISDCRVVGCPVKVWVMMKVESECGSCWRQCKEEWKNRCNDRDDKCDDCEDNCYYGWEDKCCYQVNGTYSVELYWWNKTQEDWTHLKYLQEETNITLCWKHIETYIFTPMAEGEYKVVVVFTTETETVTFSSED